MYDVMVLWHSDLKSVPFSPEVAHDEGNGRVEDRNGVNDEPKAEMRIIKKIYEYKL
jgi:hypothetical protein